MKNIFNFENNINSPAFAGESFDLESCVIETLEFLREETILESEFKISTYTRIATTTDSDVIHESVTDMVKSFKERILKIIAFLRRQATKFFNSVAKFIGTNNYVARNIDYLKLTGKKKYEYSGKSYDFSLLDSFTIEPLVEIKDAVDKVRSFSVLDAKSIDEMVNTIKNEFSHFKIDTTTLEVIRGKIIGENRTVEKAGLLSAVNDKIVSTGSKTVSEAYLKKITVMYDGKYIKMSDKVTKAIDKVEGMYKSIIKSLEILQKTLDGFAKSEDKENLFIVGSTYISMIIGLVTSINADIMLVLSTTMQNFRRMITEMNRIACEVIAFNKKEADAK